MIYIEILPASYGDCFLVRCVNKKATNTNILIDCGFYSTYSKYLKPRLDALKAEEEVLDLMVVTHIDVDHISGLIKFLRKNGKIDNPKIIPIKEIWHNGFKQMYFQKLLKARYTEIEKNQLNLFNNSKNQESKKFSEVNAEHDVNLIDAIFKGKYEEIWNKSTKAGGITTDNLNEVSIGNAKLILLSPATKELEELNDFCLDEFERKLDANFELKDDSYILDAVWENIIKEEKGSNKPKFVPVSNTNTELKRLLEGKNFSPQKLTSLIRYINKNRIKEDTSIANKSSITFILEHENQKVLFLGDTVPSIVIGQLEALKENGYSLYFDAIKISHHGSKKNTSQDLLDLIDSENYIISTNGFKFNHPNLETLIWIVSRDLVDNKKRKLIFNYKTEASDLMDNEILKSYFKDSYVIIEANPMQGSNYKTKLEPINISLG